MTGRGQKNIGRPALVGTLIVTALLCAAAVSIAAADPRSPTASAPDPALSPAQVVRIEVEALAKNDVPHKNAGIEIAFRFASPASRSVNGPLERFIGLINSAPYRSMLNHRGARYGTTRIDEDSAQVPVVITGATGQRVGYVFSLSKQPDGRCAACWMIESVIRFDISEDTEGWFMM